MDELIKSIYKVDLTLNDVQALTRGAAKIIMYDDLTIDDNILKVIGPTNRAILLFPTEAGSVNGHYLCLIYYKDIKTLLHFDSYGLDVQAELKYSTSRHVQRNTLGYLYNKLRGYGYKVLFNTYKYQQMVNGINTCGRHVACRLRFHYLNEIQYAKLMLNQSNTPDYIVTIITLLKLDKDNSSEEQIIKQYLNIKS